MSEIVKRDRGFVAPHNGDDSAPIVAGGGNTIAQMNVLGMVQSAAMLPARNIESIEAAVKKEAAHLGELAGYSWKVGGKEGGVVSGGTIKLANMLARVWGKCTVVPELVSEDSRQWVLKATFFDYETMAALPRLFIQRKRQETGMRDGERAADLVFQIGQSKAIRNATLNAMPAWLVQMALEEARKGAKKRVVEANNIPAQIAKAVAVLAAKGISKERIEAVYQKSVDEFDADDLVDLRAKYNAMQSGEESADTLFPRDSAEPPDDETKGKAADSLFGKKQ